MDESNILFGKIGVDFFMTRGMIQIQNKLNNMENVKEKLGETIYGCIQEETNFTRDIGKYALNVIMECTTQRELNIANNMLIAITGCCIEYIMEEIEKRDRDGYFWESI